MEAMNDAVKYVVQARKLLEELEDHHYLMDEGHIEKIYILLEKAEEALVRV